MDAWSSVKFLQPGSWRTPILMSQPQWLSNLIFIAVWDTYLSSFQYPFTDARVQIVVWSRQRLMIFFLVAEHTYSKFSGRRAYIQLYLHLKGLGWYFAVHQLWLPLFFGAGDWQYMPPWDASVWYKLSTLQVQTDYLFTWWLWMNVRGASMRSLAL